MGQAYLKCQYEKLADTIKGYEEYRVSFMSPAQHERNKRFFKRGNYSSLRNNQWCYAGKSELVKKTGWENGHGIVRLTGIYFMDRDKMIVGIDNVRMGRVCRFKVPRESVIFSIPEEVG